MKVVERLQETLDKLAENNINGPFTFRMPTSIAAQLAREVGQDFCPDAEGNILFAGHRIIAEDKITIEPLA